MICRSGQVSDPRTHWALLCRTLSSAALILCSAVSLSLLDTRHAQAQQSTTTPNGGFSVGVREIAPRRVTPVLTIVPERLFASTLMGRRLSAELEQQGTMLAQENRKIEIALAEEESELTALRAETSPEEFTVMADTFDEKVQATRIAQDEKARQLTIRSNEAEQKFLSAIVPVLNALMTEYGAVVVLDRRSVFVSLDASDITDQAIARIDADLGDGTGQSE